MGEPYDIEELFLALVVTSDTKRCYLNHHREESVKQEIKLRVVRLLGSKKYG
jgi:hypothetical protein